MTKRWLQCLMGLCVLGTATAYGMMREEGMRVDPANDNGQTQPISRDFYSAPWPKIVNDCYLSVAADFLWWEANQGDTDYAGVYEEFADVTLPTLGLSGVLTVQSDRNVHYKFDPGFRVAIGARPHYDDWHIDLIWTHFNTSANDRTDFPDDITAQNVYSFYFIPPFSGMGTNGPNAKAHWQAWYNTLDLDLSRAFAVSKYFGFKGHVGVRNLWLREKYANLFINNSAQRDAPFVIFYDTLALSRENIWGIGPMIGLDSIWKVYRGFSVFGNVMFSMMYSNVNSTLKGYVLTSPSVKLTSQRGHFHAVLPEIDILLGGQYDAFFSDDRYHLNIRLGWEFRNLFNSDALFGATTVYGSSFMLSGLTTGFCFDF